MAVHVEEPQRLRPAGDAVAWWRASRVQSGDPRTISPVSFEARRGPLRAGTSPAIPPAASAWSQRQTVAGSTPNADATCAWLAARSRTS